MRTGTDFDAYYASADPWRLANATRRDRAIARVVAPLVRNKSVLELGCGEGHLTATVFKEARFIHAVDISQVAIARAPKLRNADFSVGDMIDVNLRGYDVVAAIECIYYLSLEERERFFAKLAIELEGIFILMAPINGGNYFTDQELTEAFDRHRLRLTRHEHVYAHRVPGTGILAAVGARLPFVPERFPHQFYLHDAYIIDGRQPH
jgi:cyclopropane fatty-acyl-phospholipid synthase-like methyltransferase